MSSNRVSGLPKKKSVLWENVIGCLCNLCLINDERLKLFIVKEGGVKFLMNYWDSVSNVRGLKVVVELVRCLVSCHPIAEVIVSSGFWDGLCWI